MSVVDRYRSLFEGWQKHFGEEYEPYKKDYLECLEKRMTKYNYTMTPAEILNKARGLVLEFDGPSQMYEALERVYEYGYDMGYDDAMDVKKAELNQVGYPASVVHRQGLGE